MIDTILNLSNFTGNITRDKFVSPIPSLNHTAPCWARGPPFNPLNENNQQNNSKEDQQLGHTNIEIVIIFEGAFIVLVNLFFLVCILIKKKTRCMRETKFLVNLQATHVLIGVNSFLYYSRRFNELILIANLLLLQVFLCLICMTLERYFSILYPFKMKRISSSYHYVIVLVSWLLIGLLAALGLVFFEEITNNNSNDNELFLIFSTTLISVAILLLAFTNFKLLLIARRHFKEIGKTLVREDASLSKRNSKATFTCVVIVASFIILWFPQLIHNVLSLFGIIRAANNRIVTQIVWSIAMIDSIVNPFIQMCFNRGIRQFVKRVSLRKPSAERPR